MTRLIDSLQEHIFNAGLDDCAVDLFELRQEDVDRLASEAGMPLPAGDLVKVFGVPVKITTGDRRMLTSKVTGPVTFSIGAVLNG